MPAFAFIGAAVAASATGIAIAATLGISAAVLGGIVAFGAAYITSRVINGNANKGANSARNEGGRIQVAPATNNKIPVIYGNAYVNGMITDAKLATLDQKDNNVMFYCLVLGETTNNINTTYGLESVYWNDLRLTALSSTSTESHIVKDGRKVVEGAVVTAGSFVPASGSTPAKTYVITKLGTTTQAQWNTIAGTSGRVYGVGSVFEAATNGASSGNGQAQEEDFIDTNFIVDTNQYVSMRIYAGGSTAADQIFPTNSNNKANAYNFWGSTPANPNGDGSWTAANEMKGLVFAIVKLRYGGDKGFTALPNVTFQIANNVTNPADVWYDYMTSERYGAGIDPVYIDTAAQADWYDFCEEDISYTGVNLDPQGGAGTTNQISSRYSINGVIDTSNQVKTNIDTILQNGGAWMSYNVDTGLWSPIIKKAVSAGIPTEASTLFTASRTGTTLTVTTFPSGRIEAGQLLYNSSGTYIGTISAQLTPTAGETAGQIGRYTTSSSGVISSTTFYTLPASTLEFSDDNIISGITLSSTRLEDLYNEVEVEFYNKYNKDQKAYFRSYLDQENRNPNEPDNQLRMSLDLCNNSVQADIIGQMELRQSRDDLVIEFTSTHYGIQAQGGDVIAVTSELYGWYPKYFRVMRVKEIEGDDGSLLANIQALEYNPDTYTIEPITEFSTAANIGIGVYGASPNLPLPPAVVIASVDADAPIPNFELQVTVPASGGPFDEIELYYTEGWDQHGINGKIVPGQVAVTAATGNGSTATLTFATQTFTPYDVGQVVTIAGMTPSGYNGVKTITGATASTISYASTTTGSMTVAGTITNAAGAGLGLLTVTNTTYGNINPGDRIDLPSDIYIVSQLTNNPVSKTFVSGGAPASSTSTLLTLNNVTGLLVGNTLTGTGIPNGSFIIEIDAGTNTVRIEDAVTAQAAGTYTVTGGLGTYIVDTSVMASNIGGTAVDLYDFPEADNYKILKKLVPQGNDPTFTNNQVIRDVVTNVPANSATYRRWFVIARMGIKKQFGAFSEPGDTDFDQGRFPYNPNPSGSGGAGVFTSVDINNTTPWLTFSTQPDGVNPKHGVRGKSTVDDYWFVGGGSAGDDEGYLELATADNSGTGESNSGGQIYVRQYNGSGVGGPEWVGGPGTAQRTLTLLDNLGNTIIPQNLTVDSGTLFVDATNNRVGINNTSPQYELHIDNGSDGVNQFAMTNSERTFILTNAASSSDPTQDLLSFNYGGNNKLQFNANTGYQWFNSGRLGINNSSPAYTLDVTGEAYINSTLTVHGSTYLGNDYITDSTNVVGNFDVTNNSISNLFVDHTTGYVGINDNTPSYNLDVNGTANIETSLTVPSITTLTGDNLNITAFAGRDVTISTTASADPVTIARNTTSTGSGGIPVRTLTLRVDSTGTPVVGFGNQLEFETETTPGTTVQTGYINNQSTGDNAGVLDEFKMSFGVMSAGTTTTRMELDNLGNLQIDGDITVSGGDITLNGSSSGSIKLSAGTSPATQTYTLPTAYPSVNNYVLHSTTAGVLSWAVDDNTTYGLSATTTFSTNPSITLTPSSGSANSVQLIGGDGIEIVRNDGVTITITNTTVMSDIDNNVQITNSAISGTSLQEITSFPTSTIRSNKYFITMKKGTDYHMIEASIIHNGTNSFITTSNSVFTNASLGTLSTDIVSSRVRLLITPATTGSMTILANGISFLTGIV